MTNGFEWVIEGLRYCAPELILVAAIVALTLIEFSGSLAKSVDRVLFIPVLALGLAIYLTYDNYSSFAGNISLFKGSLSYDRFSLFFKLLFLSIAFVGIAVSYPYLKDWKTGFSEFLILLLSCTLGMILMASSRTFLMMFLNLEFVSITSYVMTGLLRHNKRSIEASLKYIIYGAGSSGIMLFGMSYLYGFTGSIDVYEVGKKISELQLPSILILITSVFVFAGFAYKMAIAPFHMWCPDVYEGAPTPVTAFFSTGPKLAGFAMMIRYVEGVYSPSSNSNEWKFVVFVLALLSMVVGNLVALHQSNIKRLMAYSGIAHAGYMALIFLVFGAESKAALMFYAVIYTLMNLGAFVVVIILEKYYGVETVEGSSGFIFVSPLLAVCTSIFMFSLVGLPPLAGFFGKVILFSPLINNASWMNISAVIFAVLFSVVSLFYYAKLVKYMFLRQPNNVKIVGPVPLYLNILLVLFTAGVVICLLKWDLLYQVCKNSAL